MDDSLQRWLQDNGYGGIRQQHSAGGGGIRQQHSAGGGSISQAGRITLDSGQTLFLKRNQQAPRDFFAAEAHGLDTLARELGTDSGLRIPEVIHADKQFILLEDLGSARPDANFYRQLGKGVARLHQCAKSEFGFDRDNYCGATPQSNPVTADGYAFFAEHRLLYLGIQAYDNKLFSRAIMTKLESIAANLPQWIPQQVPVLLHGDLWSGNAHCDGEGNAALIDPACYWGWAEADLAMSKLFGGFSADFYNAYGEINRLDPDWQERVPLYNLYHLLNHLILFGDSYLSSIESSCNYFAGR